MAVMERPFLTSAAGHAACEGEDGGRCGGQRTVTRVFLILDCKIHLRESSLYMRANPNSEETMVLRGRPRLEVHWSGSGAGLERVVEGNVRQDEVGKARQDQCREDGGILTKTGNRGKRLAQLVINDSDVKLAYSDQCGTRHAMELGSDLELSEDREDSERRRESI